MNKGKLYLIPAPIADQTADKVIPDQVKNELKHIQQFLVENIRTARRYLSSLKLYESIESLHFEKLDKDTTAGELEKLIAPIHDGFSMGIISESGCPGIADPGALAVAYAHRHNITVVPLVGPSSIILALMASGLNGQHFAFHGYLPIKNKEADHAIREWEKESSFKKQTQIFIETPYRNNALLDRLLKTLHPNTSLCIAIDVTGPNEWVRCMTIKQWRQEPNELRKDPAIFLFLANS